MVTDIGRFSVWPRRLAVWLLAVIVVVLSQGAQAERYVSDRVGVADLGRSVQPSSLQLGAACVQGTVQYHPHGRAQLDYWQGMDDIDSARQVYGEVHGGVNLFIAAGSVSTSITQRNATDNLTLSSQLHLQLDQGSSSLEQRTVLPGSSSANCGEQFVYQVRYGQDIFLNARWHFRSEDDYQKFVTKVKVRVLFFKKTYTKVKELESHAKNAVLDIDVSSSAPLPAPLQALLQAQPRYCPGNNIAPCLATLQHVVDYLVGDTGLRADLATMPLQPRQFVTASYQDSGYFLYTNTLQTSSISYDERWLGVYRRFGQANRDLQRAEAFLAVASDEEREQATAHWQAAEQQQQFWAARWTRCQAQPWLAECLL